MTVIDDTVFIKDVESKKVLCVAHWERIYIERWLSSSKGYAKQPIVDLVCPIDLPLDKDYYINIIGVKFKGHLLGNGQTIVGEIE